MAESLLKGVLLSGAVVESVIYISFLSHHCISTMFMIFTFHYISLFFILIKLQHLADYGFHFLSPPFSASHVVFFTFAHFTGSSYQSPWVGLFSLFFHFLGPAYEPQSVDGSMIHRAPISDTSATHLVYLAHRV